MKIIRYEEKYRDDIIFMVLQAKDALGRVPRLNEDLLDIKTNYIDRGDMFWTALDDNDRVIGCGGYSRIEGTNEAFLHRLYVKASEKRKGIGSALLETIEAGMRESGITTARVHLGDPPEQWLESYSFYPKHGYTEYAPRYMMKKL
ncbi:MAG: GNAT family N-acetyltransferase [Oscillospiraceae bacterium]|nr:GNAT family N-acetyltransferase [Oscillospiraceae bacterium]